MSTSDATQRLMNDFRASKVSFTMFGTKKTLSDDQKAEAASAFGAAGEFLSAGKKLIDTRHPAYRAVTSIKSQAGRYWQGMTLPYPESGIRLIREGDLVSFAEKMEEFRGQLFDAVDALNSRYWELRTEAQAKLGRLYNSGDYPSSLLGLFGVAWEFPNVEPPEYLRLLKPELYQAECARIQVRFDEAVSMAEQAFIVEFERMVSHLAERLTGTDDDGKPKQFMASTVTNLLEFFDRFRHMSVGSNEQLEQLVAQAQGMIGGMDPNSIRPTGDNVTVAQEMLRSHLAGEMSGIAEQLHGLMEVKPSRRVIRPKKPELAGVA